MFYCPVFLPGYTYYKLVSQFGNKLSGQKCYFTESGPTEWVPFKTPIAAAKAFELIRLVPETLKHPELTAEWEKRLGKIAAGEENKNRFISDIRQNTMDLVNKIKASEFKFTITNLSKEKCPICGKPMMKFTDKFVCSDRKCGHETGAGKETGMRTGRKSKKDRQMDRQLVSRFGKQKQQEETLGDLFDL